MITEISTKYFFEKIDKRDSFALYVGGTWCENCLVVEPLIDLMECEVFNIKPRGDSIEPIHDFRKCNNEEQRVLYKKFIDVLNYKNSETVMVEEVDTQLPLLRVPAVLAIKNGNLVYTLIEEYTKDNITQENIDYYNKELNKITKMIK